jgi:cytochrome c biogenesis protein CcmG/thiol:disulfide interchange protein DsbE
MVAGTLRGMSARLAIAAGLVTGVVAAAVLLVALVAVIPDPGAPSVRPTVPPAIASAAAPSGSAAPSGPVAGASGSAAPSASAGEAAFHVGEPAPDLDLPQVGGGRIALAELRGKPVWVNFMATWCPPCIDEFPVMNGFAARYAEEGLVVVAVDVREDEGTVAAFAESLNTAFPIGLDADGAAQEAWGARALPVHFWIDAEGVIRAGSLGGIGPDVMAASLRTIMPGVEVTP